MKNLKWWLIGSLSLLILHELKEFFSLGGTKNELAYTLLKILILLAFIFGAIQLKLGPINLLDSLPSAKFTRLPSESSDSEDERRRKIINRRRSRTPGKRRDI